MGCYYKKASARMARLTLDDLTKPLTQAQVTESIYNVLAALGVDTTTWKPGAVVRTMIASVSVVFAAYTDLMASIARSGFLELSSGEWLTLVAYHVYGVQRLDATFATGDLQVTNSGGGLYELDPGDLIVRSATTGRTYRNTAAFTLNPGEPPKLVAIAATESGAASSALPETITQIVSTTLLGVTVKNPAAIYGEDAEPDSTLRVRCAELLGSLSPMGPWDAYSYALRNATLDGRNLGITRVSLVADGFGHVDLYCATASGTVSDTDLVAADEAVQQNAAPQAITARVHSAVGVSVFVVYQAWVYNTSGHNAAQITALIDESLRVFFGKQPVGGNIIETTPGAIYVDAIRTAIGITLPEIFHVELHTPSADVVLAQEELARYVGSPGSIVHLVPPPEAYRP
jgi:phage-related baseplate assembly protein